IHTPLSAASSPFGPNVIGRVLLPRPPWPFWHRKISHAPEQTPPKVGGLPQSQPFFHPSFSNQAKLCWISDTLRIGVSRFANTRSSFPEKSCRRQLPAKHCRWNSTSAAARTTGCAAWVSIMRFSISPRESGRQGKMCPGWVENAEQDVSLCRGRRPKQSFRPSSRRILSLSRFKPLQATISIGKRGKCGWTASAFPGERLVSAKRPAMKIRGLTSWNLTPKEAVAMQRALAAQVDSRTPLVECNLVAGADVSYD